MLRGRALELALLAALATLATVLARRRSSPVGTGEDELEAMRREADDNLVIAAALCAWQAGGRGIPDEPERGSARVRSVHGDEGAAW
jgi:hypothetical protein